MRVFLVYDNNGKSHFRSAHKTFAGAVNKIYYPGSPFERDERPDYQHPDYAPSSVGVAFSVIAEWRCALGYYTIKEYEVAE